MTSTTPPVSLANESIAATTQKYVGEDRRTSRNKPLAMRSALVFWTAALLASVAAAALLINTNPGRPEDRAVLSIVLATAAAAVSLAGAVLCFVRFQLIRERISLASGVILLLVGAGWLLPARVGPMLRIGWREELGGFALGSTAMTAAVVISLFLLPNVDESLTIVRHVFWAAAGVAVFGTVLAVGLPDTIAGTGLSGPALGQVLAGPLLGLTAAALLILGYRRSRGILVFVGIGLLGLEVAELLAIRALSTDDAWWLSSTLLSLAAVSAALYGVGVEYQQGHQQVQTKLFESWLIQQRTSRNAEWERAKQEETFHDLRAGLLGVEAVALSGALRSAAEDGLLTQELARLRKLTMTAPSVSEPLNVVQFVESIVELRLRQGEAVTLDAKDEILMTLAPNELAETLFNLLDNAARHATRSPVVVSLREHGTDVEFVIQDRGPGISQDMLPKLFRRGVTSHQDGSGLGLYISAEVVNRLGGTLEATNRVGGGARFSFTIPAIQPKSSLTPPPEEPKSKAPAESWLQRLREKMKKTRVERLNADTPAEPAAPAEPLQVKSGWTRER